MKDEPDLSPPVVFDVNEDQQLPKAREASYVQKKA
jgi:hypothetical protein